MTHTLTRSINIIIVCLLLTGALIGCSQYSTRPAAVNFHNISSHYNAYFIAEQDMQEAEFAMKAAYKEDYNQLLPILLPLDSVLALPVKPQLLDAVKKASIVAEKHQNSKWVDNSYVILGKSRLYLGQWADGLEALRYVYANGKDEDDKNKALVVLMRAYASRKDYSNALGVAEYLSQQPLTKEATKEFYLTKAYLHQQNGEYLTSVAILEETFPLLDKSTETARLHFAAAQMYDRLGQYVLANKHYKNVSRNRPDYDLGFYSSMNSLQNQVIIDPKTDVSSVGFDKMLRDRKNSDLRDRVYFTMGLLAEHRKQLPEAVEYLQKSASFATGGNGVQKAYTYLQLARIHYDALEKYEFAKAYYDSALTILPKDAAEYRVVSDRKTALDNFVTQQTIVKMEDSLQILARMNPKALDDKIDGIIEAQEKKRIADEKKAKEALALAAAAQGGMQNGLPSTANGNDRRWELYDPSMINKGKIEFRRVWGNRVLEDDWRRSTKQNRALAGNNFNSKADSTAAVAAAAETVLTKESPVWKERHANLKKNIPLTDSSFAVSQKKKEDALYNLGKIYRFDLKEPERSVAAFNRVLNEYPQTQYKEEIFYLMYLTLPESDKDRLVWKDKLMSEFPNSTYARLLNSAANDGTTGDKDRNNPVKAYESAYKLYADGNYTKALEDIESNLPAYKGSMLEDKFALLRVFLVGKTRGREAYLQAINEFVRLYPNSMYLPRLKEMQELREISVGKR
ncbi:tetratricopeptide repeat protein [Dyadobacter sp. LHD-138]|uniref:type IX secretion system periplasmic lipoprotein PorW/SprE n=1 Tax=Dyadobacter sp. LHD-138 TaxID=3071413 RepID=UPI0027E0AC0D|nr:tetratricopeptide repeat protein [Dyadobacter sp. LHD-138]MDQ6480835.1 tetratricopeptide repeat protein [Dyadobacter sp. LHD-138]